jgi:L-amino acid N-acyltransferase YncA
MAIIVVRSSSPADLPYITRIYGHHVLNGTATFEIDPPSEAEMARRRETVLALDLPYLVAVKGDDVVGYAYAGAYRPRPGYRFTVEDSIYIHPEHCGCGAGRALLGALLEDCRQGPWQQMIAVIGDTSNLASIGLHRKFGFRLVGTLHGVGFKFDRWIDSVLLQLPLGTIPPR